MPNVFKPKTNTAAKLSLGLGGALPLLLLFGGSYISRSSYNTAQNHPLDQPVFFSHKHHALELGIDCRYCHTSVENSAKASVPSTETCMTCHSLIWTNSPMLEPVRKSYAENTPIVWNKVNKLPEFVYFDHSIHVARGINCNTCHGPVQDMHMTWKGHALSMAWCLECHFEPEKYVREFAPEKQLSPQEQVFEFYRQMQTGETLRGRDYNLSEGFGRTENASEIKKGEELLAKYKVNKKQLSDCWTCHR